MTDNELTRFKVAPISPSLDADLAQRKIQTWGRSFMKKLFAMLMALVVFSQPSFASDCHSHKAKGNKHIYIDAAKVTTTDKGIHINIDGEIIPIRCIHSDKNGLFINESQLKSSPEFVNKRIHRCVCHWCGKIFIAIHWQKYCSPTCEYEGYAHG
jgi:hypothetical protein